MISTQFPYKGRPSEEEDQGIIMNKQAISNFVSVVELLKFRDSVNRRKVQNYR